MQIVHKLTISLLASTPILLYGEKEEGGEGGGLGVGGGLEGGWGAGGGM